MRYLQQVALKERHTLAAPAWAACLVELEHPEEVALYQRGDHILGGGSNTIFVGNIDKRLLHPVFEGIEVIKEDAHEAFVRALAGTQWHELVQWSVSQGLYGLENLALIPGTVGAAPVQNIGAYGVECGDCLHKVEVFDADSREFVHLSAQDCGFAYRQSRFKQDWKGRFFIVAVSFRLAKQAALKRQYAGIGEDVGSLAEMFARICDLRRAKLPDPAQQPNAGSFFHNPVLTQAQYQALLTQYQQVPFFAFGEALKIPAAWLIEQCGFKGRFCDGVGMSAQHALVLVNQGGTGMDILRYAQKVQAAVYEKFKIELVIEPEILGEGYGN